MKKDLIEKRSEVIQNLFTLYLYAVGENDEYKQYAFNRYQQGKWFVVEKIGDRLLFGPSRFVGYKNNSIKKHTKDHGDGTETNYNFKKRSMYVEIKDDEFLIRKFNEFLAGFNLSKSTAPSFLIPTGINMEDFKSAASCFFISPTHCQGYKPDAWHSFLDKELMSIGWNNEDYTQAGMDEIEAIYADDRKAIQAFRQLKGVKYGDIVCATNNNNWLWGIGVALSSYKYTEFIHYAGIDKDQKKCYYSHYADVAWINYNENRNEHIKPADLNIGKEEKLWSPYGALLKSTLFPQYITRYLFKEKLTTINTMEIENYTELLRYKKQLIFQGAPGTGKTYTAKDIAGKLIFNTVSQDKKLQAESLKKSEQFKLIQFHPSYTYEDFVRGIVVEVKSGGIEYNTVNKVLAEFAEKALKNYINSQKTEETLKFKRSNEELLETFKTKIADKLSEEEFPHIGNTKGQIKELNEIGFRYSTPGGKGINTLSFNNIIILMNSFPNIMTNSAIINKSTELNLGIKSHETYYKEIIGEIRKETDSSKINAPGNKKELKNYVLIIDEINRANLPSVLGELIYALEYRGEKVESMYAVNGDNNLILPPNLFIIGTMNTADRSVGQIDYAIRRRFAFVDMLPKVLVEEPDFNTDLFKKVSEFFIKNVEEYVNDPENTELVKSDWLSDEFSPEDVWIGHSYFIMNNDNSAFRLNYEIKPILREYLKDGILKESASGENTKDLINNL